MYWLYTTLLGAGTLLASPYFLYKACTTEKYRHGLAQRLGRLPSEVVSGLAGRWPLWVHAVSVGEVMAAIPLIERIQAARPELPVVVSTVTRTGYRTALREIPGAEAVLYFPLDFPWTVGRALETLQPRCVCLVETELWPNFLRACGERAIPVLVLNGRISDRSYPRYRRLRPFFRRVLANVAWFSMRTPQDAERIQAMGAPAERVVVMGNLKYDRATAQADGERTEGLREAFGLTGGETVLVAASTHHGEEEAVLTAFAGLRQVYPHLRLLLVPRHPERFAEAEALITRWGMTYRKRSAPPPAGGEAAPPVLLLDSMGELTAAYPLATLVFIGGSLVPVGGHNALEAAAAGKATLFGPYMNNFEQEAGDLLAAGGARQVHDARSLAAACHALLDDPAALEAMGRAALEAVEAGRGAAERTFALLEPYLALEAGS
ncbi:MAG: 3-deoxy-D-manno-octulosonic acid transferase [Nitrospinota bacterium]